MDVRKYHGSQRFYDWRPWFVFFLRRTHVNKSSLIYGVAVAVPGELRGWEHLHKKYGKLPWSKLFKGAIKLARYGFTLNADLAVALNNGRNARYLQFYWIN